MDQKYKVSLSGNILNNSMEETVKSLSSIILEKQPSELEQLIQNKATIKRNVDLTLANKIKSKLELAGVECVISLDTQDAAPHQNYQAAEESQEKPQPSDLSSNKTEGIVFISTAIILMLTLLFISDGYAPQLGLLWSINENMEIYSGYPFGCPEPVFGSKDSSNSYSLGLISGGCADSFHITLKTKYFLLGTLLLLAFGIGRYLGNFSSLKEYWNKIRKAVSEG